MNSKIATNINTLGKFCGIRDINELSQEKLLEYYGIRQADVMVLFGGSILAGGDVLAEAIKNNIFGTLNVAKLSESFITNSNNSPVLLLSIHSILEVIILLKMSFLT